jgi:uncharacterized paraquat-inducible protein A
VNYDARTAEAIVSHMEGAISCVHCKMMYVPRLRPECPFCQIFSEGKERVELQPIRPLQ